ncbi:MAG: hypothetical protein HYR94_15160, partial [Chloroflexi bacterium]|nr:hypothetical protein [Chloroflexota bacterium]
AGSKVPVSRDALRNRTQYGYDSIGNLKVITNTLGQTTTFSYDALGRKTFMHDPDMGKWYYQYDPAGNLTAQVDANHLATNLYYDALNRLKGKTYTAGVSDPVNYTRPADTGAYTLTYTYDLTDSAHGAGKGRRTGMSAAAGVVNWKYDSQGRLLSETRQFTGAYNVLTNTLNVPGGAYVTGYTYDAADRVRTTTYPDGEVVTSTYTARNLPLSLATSLGGSYISTAGYDALANPTGRTAGNGLATSYGYYPINQQGGRLLTMTVGSALLSLSYSYDAVGNVLSIADTVAGQSQSLSFTYDHLDRLVAAEASANGSLPGFYEAYAYDNIGNLTQRAGQNYSYPNSGSGSIRPHAVTGVGSNSYTYDNNGNMITRPENAVTYSQQWTEENKLKRVTWTQSGQAYTTTFVYDGDGNRLLKIEDSTNGPETTTAYIGQLYEEQFDTTSSNLQASAATTRPGDGDAEAVALRPGGGEAGDEAMRRGSEEADRINLAQSQRDASQSPIPDGHDVSNLQSPSSRPAGLASPLLTASLPLGLTRQAALMPPGRPVASPQIATWDSQLDFLAGTATGLDRYDLDGSLQLLSLADDFNDNELNLDRWEKFMGLDLPLLTEQNGRLERLSDDSNHQVAQAMVGLPLTGDFEVQVDYGILNWPAEALPQLILRTQCQNGNYALILFSAEDSSHTRNFLQARFNDFSAGYVAEAPSPYPIRNGNSPWETGTFKIARTGTLWSLSYKRSSDAGFTLLLQKTEAQINAGPFGDCTLSLGAVHVEPPQLYGAYFDNLLVNKNAANSSWRYVASGTWQTEVNGGSDEGGDGWGWRKLKWETGSKPSGTDVTFKARSCTGSGGTGTCGSWQSASLAVGGTLALSSATVGQYHYLQVQVDLSSNSAQSATPVIERMSLEYVKDTTAPTATMLQPNAPYQGSPAFSVAWQGQDNHLGSSGVQSYTVQSQQGAGAWTGWLTNTLSTTALFTGSNGISYTFRVQATDKDENVSLWAYSPLTTVDTSRPILTPPPPLGLISTTSPLLRGQFSSASAILTPSLVLTLDGASLATTTAVITTGGFSRTLSLSQGPHEVRARIANTAGPNENNLPWSFTVDSLTPTLAITAFQASGRNISVAWKGSDPAPSSGALKYDVQYKIGNSPAWTGWLTQTTQVITNFVGTFGYTYTFQAQATDPAGNKSQWAQTTAPVQLERVTKYYLLGNQRVAMRQGSVVYYLHGDHLGSTSLTTDQSGALVSQARYLPYGETRWGSSGPTDFGFTSQRSEAGFGLMDYGARYYSPYLNQFISPDPIIPDYFKPQSLNRYSYAYNNPIKYNDPSGHCPMCLALAVPAVEVALVALTVYAGYTVLTSEPVQQGIGDLTEDAGKWVREGMTEVFPTEEAQEQPSLEGTPLSDQSGQQTVETFPTESLSLPNILITTMAVGQLPSILMAKYKGGIYQDIPGSPGTEKHHMPADSVNPLSTNKGSVIEMDTSDHRATASWGNSRSAQIYRAIQEGLIGQGSLDDAIQMDIDDVQSKFGGKYDEAILEMIDKLP